jgi:TonB family protein
MTPQLLWSNLFAYSVQVAVLVAVAAGALWAFRVRVPRARLLFWQGLMCSCLLLPALQPWEQRSTTVATFRTAPATSPREPAVDDSAFAGWDWATAGLAVLALGTAFRLGWLGLGVVRLLGLRRRARDLHPLAPGLSELRAAIAPGVRIALSDEVSGPVTFGAAQPVVLLPPGFSNLTDRAQQAIVCHELLHVARRDWLFTLAEEAMRALLWFHPAIWWLLAQVQLSREQAVDRQAVAITDSRNEYLDALLAVAGGRPQPDLAPASLFLRSRQLKKRVASILMETTMSKLRLAGALAASALLVLAVSWLTVGAFPISAAPQTVADAEGITVDTGGAAIAHRAGVGYPNAARAKGVQGTVAVDVTIAADGTVIDARVASGPDELRRASLEAVLQMHFARSAAGAKRVNLTFTLPNGPVPSSIRPAGGFLGSPSMMVGTAKIKKVEILGLGSTTEQELRSRLPVVEGEILNEGTWGRLHHAATEFDEHLFVGIMPSGSDEVTVRIMAPGNTAARTVSSQLSAEQSAPPAGVQRIRVGGNVQQTKLTNKTQPVYPPLAKQARIQGVVKLQTLIDAEGRVKSLQAISGHPLLVPAALEAVRQWTYQATLLNGNPVEVVTQVDVNFTLAE